MAMPFGGLLFFYKKGNLWNKIRLLLIAILGIAVIAGVEAWAYSEEEWQDYLEYNQYRSDIFDYYGIPPYEENSEFYHSIGMEEWDVANLERCHLFFIDDIENGRMKQLAEYAGRKWRAEHSLWERAIIGIKCSIKGFFNLRILGLNLFTKLILLCNLIYEIKKRKKSRFLNMGFLVVEGVLWLYLGYQGRLPARVGGSLLLIELLSVLSVFYQEHIREQEPDLKPWVKKVLGVFLIGAVLYEINTEKVEQQALHNRNLEMELLENFYADHEKNVYFITTYLTSGYTENFKVVKEPRLSNGFALGGWTSFSPVRNEGLRRFGILDVDKAIIEQDNVYLIMVAESSKVEGHFEEKYGKISWDEVGTAPVFGVEIPIYQIRPKGEGT